MVSQAIGRLSSEPVQLQNQDTSLNSLTIPKESTLRRDQFIADARQRTASDGEILIPQFPVQNRQTPAGSLQLSENKPDIIETLPENVPVPGTQVTPLQIKNAANQIIENTQRTINANNLSDPSSYNRPAVQDALVSALETQAGIKINRDPELNRAAQEVVDKLAKSLGAEGACRIVVADNPGVGMFAPGHGVIVIKKEAIMMALREGNGKIDPNTQAGAGFIGMAAHEIGHNYLRHNEILDVMDRFTNAYAKDNQLSEEAKTLVGKYMKREFERSADQFAVNLVRQEYGASSSGILDRLAAHRQWIGDNNLGADFNGTNNPRNGSLNYDSNRLRGY